MYLKQLKDVLAKQIIALYSIFLDLVYMWMDRGPLNQNSGQEYRRGNLWGWATQDNETT